MRDVSPEQVLQPFRFEIWLDPSAVAGGAQSGPTTQPLGDGAFQECTGLELEADIREYQEGGRNDRVVRRVGRVKLQPVVLKRGMFAPASASSDRVREVGGRVVPELWVWLQDMVEGRRPIPRYDGIIGVRGPSGDGYRAIWTFVRGLPLKVVGPALNAKTAEIAIEELHIAHEGLRLETS